jgi:hypothetical protein
MGVAVNYSCLNSLKSANGKSCHSSKTEIDFGEYLDRKKVDFGVSHLSEDRIVAIITSNLRVRLSAGSNSTLTTNSLRWLRSQMSTTGASSTAKIILQNH